jgi:hypothetical protein
MGFIPEVGTWKNIYEAVSGKDLVTGEDIEPWQRGVKVLASLPGESKVIEAADLLDKALDAISLVTGIIDGVRESERIERLSGEDPPPDPKAGPMHYPPHGTP